MATAGPNTSRRALLGALAAAPLVAMPVVPAFASSSQWDAALAHLERAHAAYDAACSTYSKAQGLYFDARPAMPNGAAFLVGETVETYNARVRAEKEARELADKECLRRFGVDEAEEAEGHACDAACAALDAALAVPAPNLAAVIRKIELAGDFGREIDDLGPVLADLRRLGAH